MTPPRGSHGRFVRVAWLRRRNEVPPDGSAPECFVCSGPRDLGTERPGRWFRGRFACGPHKAEARLANGMRVGDFLRTHSRAYQLEGGLLGLVINPVLIGSARGFTDWAAGGWAVLEEVFPSRNFVEFSVLHDPEWNDGLFAAHRAVRANPSLSIVELFALTSRAMPAFSQRLASLAHAMARQGLVDEELKRRRISAPRTADEAEDLVRLQSPSSAPSSEALAAVVKDLAARRFAHLGGA